MWCSCDGGSGELEGVVERKERQLCLKVEAGQMVREVREGGEVVVGGDGGARLEWWCGETR
jgi:hypothetical protein